MTHDQTVVQIGRRRPARESNQRVQNTVPSAPSPVSPTPVVFEEADKPFASVCWWSLSLSVAAASCSAAHRWPAPSLLPAW